MREFDRRQATELACLVCRSPEAVEQFLSFCGCQAFDLLAEHATALMSMHIILRMRRTMSGAELDDAIASVLRIKAWRVNVSAGRSGNAWLSERRRLSVSM